MKWIIVATFPSGSRMAFSRYKDQFALVPIDGVVVRMASAWDSEADANEYLDAQLEVAPKLAETFKLSIERCELPQ